MLGQRADGEPALKQRCVHVSCLLGGAPLVRFIHVLTYTCLECRVLKAIL